MERDHCSAAFKAAVGLAGVDIKEHIKASFGFTWLLSIICLVFAALMKIIPL